MVNVGTFCEHCFNLKEKQLTIDGYCLDCGFANDDISEEALEYLKNLEKQSKSKPKKIVNRSGLIRTSRSK